MSNIQNLDLAAIRRASEGNPVIGLNKKNQSGTVIGLVPATRLAKVFDCLAKRSANVPLHFGRKSANLARRVARTSQITVPKHIFLANIAGRAALPGGQARAGRAGQPALDGRASPYGTGGPTGRPYPAALPGGPTGRFGN